MKTFNNTETVLSAVRAMIDGFTKLNMKCEQHVSFVELEDDEIPLQTVLLRHVFNTDGVRNILSFIASGTEHELEACWLMVSPENSGYAINLAYRIVEPETSFDSLRPEFRGAYKDYMFDVEHGQIVTHPFEVIEPGENSELFTLGITGKEINITMFTQLQRFLCEQEETGKFTANIVRFNLTAGVDFYKLDVLFETVKNPA